MPLLGKETPLNHETRTYEERLQQAAPDLLHIAKRFCALLDGPGYGSFEELYDMAAVIIRRVEGQEEAEKA